MLILAQISLKFHLTLTFSWLERNINLVSQKLLSFFWQFFSYFVCFNHGFEVLMMALLFMFLLLKYLVLTYSKKRSGIFHETLLCLSNISRYIFWNDGKYLKFLKNDFFHLICLFNSTLQFTLLQISVMWMDCFKH